MTTWRDFFIGGDWLTCPDPLCPWQKCLETITLGDLQFVAQDHLDETHIPVKSPPTPRVYVRPRGICSVCGEERAITLAGRIRGHDAPDGLSWCVGSRRPFRRATDG